MPGWLDTLKAKLRTENQNLLPALEELANQGGGDHPDQAAHTALGLATQAAVDSAVATHAGTPHGGDITAHEEATNPHPGYLTPAEGDAAYAPIHAHPFEASGAVSTHANAVDPHAGYQKESEKGAANGYASLDGSGLIPDAQIPSGISRDSEVSAAYQPLDSDLTAIAALSTTSFGRGLLALADAAALAALHSHGGGGGEAFPVGSVFIAVVSTNPGTLLGYGTWSAFAVGRMLVGLDSGDTDFDTAEETGGAKTVTLATAEMPAHTHVIRSQTATSGSATSYEHGTLDTSSAEAEATEVTDSTGGGGAHNNMPPYIVVYMWKRTA